MFSSPDSSSAPTGPQSGQTDIPGEPLIDVEAALGPAPATPAPTRASRILLGLSLMLVALNLRAVFSSLSVLLPEMMRGTGASAATASLVTTLPVLCLGLFSPLAPRWAQRHGSERVVLVCLLALAAGTALRGLGTVSALLGAAVVTGSSIAVVNVLLPGLVKRDFPDHIASMTGLYTGALCGGAAAAAAFTVPIEIGLSGSWQAALAAWSLPALAAGLLWAPQALAAVPAAPQRSGPRPPSLWRDGLAWQVSLFMGLQSAVAYCIFGWLAPILRARGLDAETAGYVVSVSVCAQMAGCLITPTFATRGRDQRRPVLGLWAATAIGLAGSFFAPLGAVWAFTILLGMGQGGLITLALTMILLRAPNARVAARLSGMAQGVGYTLAAGGPLLVGLLRQWRGDFSAVPLLLAVLCIAGTLAGLGAGRARLVRG